MGSRSHRGILLFHGVYFMTNMDLLFFLGGVAMLGFHCCVQAFSSYGTWGPLFVAGLRLLIAVASLVAAAGCR